MSGAAALRALGKKNKAKKAKTIEEDKELPGAGETLKCLQVRSGGRPGDEKMESYESKPSVFGPICFVNKGRKLQYKVIKIDVVKSIPLWIYFARYPPDIQENLSGSFFTLENIRGDVVFATRESNLTSDSFSKLTAEASTNIIKDEEKLKKLTSSRSLMKMFTAQQEVNKVLEAVKTKPLPDEAELPSAIGQISPDTIKKLLTPDKGVSSFAERHRSNKKKQRKALRMFSGTKAQKNTLASVTETPSESKTATSSPSETVVV